MTDSHVSSDGKAPDATDGTTDVVAAQAGDADARERLLTHHLPEVHRVCHWMLNDSEAAADATQDAFVLAMENLSQFNGDGDFGAWIRSIAINRCRRMRGRAAMLRTTELPVDIPSARPGPDDQATVALATNAVRVALERLPDEQRTAFILREVEGLSYADIAASCDTTPDAVRLRLHRARLVVLKELSPWT